jgi:hypothetical protein
VLRHRIPEEWNPQLYRRENLKTFKLGVPLKSSHFEGLEIWFNYLIYSNAVCVIYLGKTEEVRG